MHVSDFLLVISNNLRPICPLSEILRVSCEERPYPYSTQILGVFPLDYIADVALRSEDPKLFIGVISFELTQRISPQYHNVTDGRTTYVYVITARFT